MTYPSGGGPGQFPGQGPQQPQHQPPAYGVPQQQANPLAGVSLPVLLALGVTLLGVVAYFCGFSDEAAGAETQIVVMLIAGLLAAFRALPDGPKFLPVAAVLSTAGALWELDAMIGIPEGAKTPGILVVILIMGILQMLVAVAALLFDFGVLKLPAPGPAVPQYGPPSGQFPQQGQQPTQQYGAPGAQTQYQPQPGQFPPPGQGQHPGTPPGGYPQQG